jgi:hypothetical protein
MYFYILKKYKIIKIKDNKLKFRRFLNNFINRKGVLGLCREVGFRLGVRRVMPLTLTSTNNSCKFGAPNCPYQYTPENWSCLSFSFPIYKLLTISITSLILKIKSSHTEAGETSRRRRRILNFTPGDRFTEKSCSDILPGRWSS